MKPLEENALANKITEKIIEGAFIAGLKIMGIGVGRLQDGSFPVTVEWDVKHKSEFWVMASEDMYTLGLRLSRQLEDEHKRAFRR